MAKKHIKVYSYRLKQIFLFIFSFFLTEMWCEYIPNFKIFYPSMPIHQNSAIGMGFDMRKLRSKAKKNINAMHVHFIAATQSTVEMTAIAQYAT